jgi:hypothetical protein
MNHEQAETVQERRKAKRQKPPYTFEPNPPERSPRAMANDPGFERTIDMVCKLGQITKSQAYAMKKSRLVTLATNAHLLTKSQLVEYGAAVEEYYALHPDERPEPGANAAYKPIAEGLADLVHGETDGQGNPVGEV